MTALSCRQYETRMHVAMMIDAYASVTKSFIFEPCEPGNTVSRYWQLVTDNVPQYTIMWGYIEREHGEFNWDDMADYEIDRDWTHARQHGMKINGVDVPATAFVAAQLRWNRNGWLRYEFKRSKRRAALAPFLRVAAIA